MVDTTIFIFFASFAFLFGTSVGSFLNVVAWRVPVGLSLLKPPSSCTKCSTLIKWYDNIPVLSYLILRGKCRTCGSRFSVRYAIVELLTGLLFAGAMLNVFSGGAGLALFARDAVFISLLVCAILTDLDHWIILDSVSIGGTIIGIAFSFIGGGIEFLQSLLTALGAFTLFLLIRVISGFVLRNKTDYTIVPEGQEEDAEEFQGGMGWGDIKLAAMIGAFLGPALTAVALFLAFLIGALVGVFTIIAGRNKRKPIPFGPFMAAGAVISLFTGQFIWDLYIALATPAL